jgi:hypothetical protein
LTFDSALAPGAGAVTLLCTNKTAGPLPGGPSGGGGERTPAFTMPEAWTAMALKASVATRSGGTPRAVTAAPMARMKPSGA